MKYLINFLLLVGLLVFSGCNEEGSFTLPDTNTTSVPDENITTTLSFNNFDNLESMSINNDFNATRHLLGFDSTGS